jgi:hypothetical protein
MSEYRDDLEAAHRRIAQLEEVLAVRGDIAPPRRSPVLRVGCFVAIACFPCVGAIAGLWGLVKPERTKAGTPAAVPAEPRLHVSWYTQPGVLPTMVDVDGDGAKDYVGLFWRAGHDEAPLYAAAVDGKTFTMKWSAGPFPRPWDTTLTHLTVVGDKVVVSVGDRDENVRVLELRTGNEHVSMRVPGAFIEMCPLDHVTARAVVRWSLLGEEYRGVFDADNSTLKAQPGVACGARYGACTGKDAGPPCFQDGAIPNAPREAKRSSSFHVKRTLMDGDLAIAIGTPRTGPNGREPPQAVAFVLGSATALWTASLLASGDEHFGDVQTELRGGKLVSFYQSQGGPFRLVSRDARTARLAWSSDIAGDLGSNAAAFGVEGDRVLVVMNETVHVFDAVTGVHLAGLDAESL